MTVQAEPRSVFGSTTAWATSNPRRHQLGSCALMVAVAVAWWLALPPRGWWALFPLGVAGFVLALHGHGVKRRIWLGALCGAILYPVSLRWLTDFSVPGYVALIVLETVLLCVVAAVTPGDRGGRWTGHWLVAPGALVLLEVVQHRFPFDGFPPSAAARTTTRCLTEFKRKLFRPAA